MKQILGILSVIIVLGAVIVVFFGHSAQKDKTENPIESAKNTTFSTTTTTSETQRKTSTTTTETAID